MRFQKMLFCVLLFFCVWFSYGSAQGEELPAVCANAEELLSLLSSGAHTITLTNDILWNCDAVIRAEQSVTVFMDTYSIFVPPEGSFYVDGPIRFEGTGGNAPLIRAEGKLQLRNGAEVIATGDDATAVQAADEVDFFIARVAAPGKNSVAIHANGFVRLVFCEVAAGGDAVQSDAGEIILDGCSVTPQPQNAEVTRRRAAPGYRLQENGLCIAVGGSLNEMLKEKSVGFYFLDLEQKAPAAAFVVDTIWDNLPADATTAGEYRIKGIAKNLPDWFPVEDTEAYEIPLFIVDETSPHLEFAERFGWDTVMVKFFREIQNADEIILWYSTNGGESWQNFQELPEAIVGTASASVESLPPNRVYQFRLEVRGGDMAGVSNTLEFPYYDSDPDAAGGGDRTGADRFPLLGKKESELPDSTTSAQTEPGGAAPETPPEISEDEKAMPPQSGAGGGQRPVAASVAELPPMENGIGDELQVQSRASAPPVSHGGNDLAREKQPAEQSPIPEPAAGSRGALLAAGAAAVLLFAVVAWMKIKRIRFR